MHEEGLAGLRQGWLSHAGPNCPRCGGRPPAIGTNRSIVPSLARHVRIGTLIDRNRCRRVRHVGVADAVSHIRRRHRLLNLCRDVNKLRAPIRFHAQCLHRVSFPSARDSSILTRLIDKSTQRRVKDKAAKLQDEVMPDFLAAREFRSSLNPPVPHRARNGSRHNSAIGALCGYSSDSNYCMWVEISGFLILRLAHFLPQLFEVELDSLFCPLHGALQRGSSSRSASRAASVFSESASDRARMFSIILSPPDAPSML